jgi:hypothetical protein
VTMTFFTHKRHALGRSGAQCFLALMLVSLLGCGGGSKSSAPPPPPPPLSAADMPGTWVETGNQPGVMLILPSTGTAFPARLLSASDLAQATGPLTLTGTNLAGNLLLINSSSPNTQAFPGGATSASLAITGSATANPSTINITAQGISGSFIRDPQGNSPVALATLAGNYLAASSATSGNTTVTMTIAPPALGLTIAVITGVLDPSGSNTAFSGTITPVASAVNAFRVTLSLVNPAGGNLTTTGLAYFRPTTPPSLVVMTDDGNPNQSQVVQASAILTAVP